MKVLQFTVPVTDGGSVAVQEDILPYFYSYLHRHQETQISLIIRGSGTLIAGNYTQELKPGDVYIIGANQVHLFNSEASYFETPQEDRIHALHIFFDWKNCLAPAFGLNELAYIGKFMEMCSTGLQVPEAYADQAARYIRRVAASTGPKRLLNFALLLNYFSAEVKDWKSLSTGFTGYYFTDAEGIRMNDVYRYTLHHFHEQISLDIVAEVAHMTTQAFCKYFKKHTRRTYMDFLNDIRINEACKRMLGKSGDSLSEIAFSTGFNSLVTFNRVFKRMRGMSPSIYLKQKKPAKIAGYTHRAS